MFYFTVEKITSKAFTNHFLFQLLEILRNSTIFQEMTFSKLKCDVITTRSTILKKIIPFCLLHDRVCYANYIMLSENIEGQQQTIKGPADRINEGSSTYFLI